jgi:hypothetical protein
MGALFSQGGKLEEGLLRHMILNSLRMYKTKFSKYGDMVIACDGGSWRRDYFPEYKSARRDAKDENKSGTDWEEFFRIINLVKDELIEHFHYKVVQVKGAEGDDIIAILALETQEFGKGEDVMIVSSDHDFIQLQTYSNIKQFSPLKKKMVTGANPSRYLFEHICRGCGGDGVPNILSPDNSFTNSIRQRPISQKKLDEWYNGAVRGSLMRDMNPETYRNYKRNTTLISFSEIPHPVKNQILDAYTNAPVAPKNKILPYLIKNRCNQLIGACQDFF